MDWVQVVVTAVVSLLSAFGGFIGWYRLYLKSRLDEGDRRRQADLAQDKLTLNFARETMEMFREIVNGERDQLTETLHNIEQHIESQGPLIAEQTKTMQETKDVLEDVRTALAVRREVPALPTGE